MKYTLGFSPCPNDTFIFDALVNKKIDTRNFEFDVVLEDVQTLNKWAMQGKLAVTKLSYGVLPMVLNAYAVLNSGSALGRGVGPLLIGDKKNFKSNVADCLIAIPGEQTTAHLLFSLAYPSAKNKIFMRYDEIENFVLNGKGLGVIIHENRFTYQDKSLEKIKDLGDYWEKETGNAIPLGGIVVSRNIEKNSQLEIDNLIKESIQFAFKKYPEISEYIKIHAQEMSEEVMRKHIDLYVNEYAINLGEEGRNSVKKLLKVYQKNNSIEINYSDIFVK